MISRSFSTILSKLSTKSSIINDLLTFAGPYRFYHAKNRCKGRQFGRRIELFGYFAGRNFQLFSQRSLPPSLQNPVLQDAASSNLKEASKEAQKSANETDLVEVTFITSDGERLTAKGKVGDSLLDVVVDKNLPLDGYGACEGTLACSTCHVVLKRADFDKLPEKPTDEELDMLDLAYGLVDTSRLGCQIVLSKDLNGLEVKVPEGISDARTV